MFKHYLTFCVFFILAMAMNAQNSFPYKHYLEEKVRDPNVRDYLEKRIEGTATQADLEAIQAYYKEIQSNSGRTNDLLQEGAEPHIVIHPTNKNILALAFMQNSLISADYPIYISRDGGATWTRSSFSTEAALDSVFPGDIVLGGGDPVLAFAEDGTLYLSYIYVHGNFASFSGDMFYVYSKDIGESFILPPTDDHVVYSGNLIMGDLLDRQWIDVDISGGPYTGNLYMSAAYFGGALNTEGQVILTKSADSIGFNLSTVVAAVAPTIGTITQFGNIKVDSIGRVHLSCALIDEIDGGGLIYHTVSTDGGKTFSSPTQVGSGELLFPQNGFTPDWIIHARENAAVSMDVDGDNVYIVWTDLGGEASRAYFSYSNDGGESFSEQTEFGNLLLDTSTFHFLPNVTADSGHVTISWYAVDKLSGITNYYIAESGDSGMTFDSVLMVSDTSSAFVGGQGTFYGDYNSSVKHGCTTWTVWSDGRSGAPDVYVAKTRLCDSAGGPVTSITELSPVSEHFQTGNVWPNPATDVVNIELQLSRPQLVQAEMYDLQGKLVKSYDPASMMAGTNDLKFDIADVAPGQYLLKITSGSGLFATRIMFKF